LEFNCKKGKIPAAFLLIICCMFVLCFINKDFRGRYKNKLLFDFKEWAG